MVRYISGQITTQYQLPLVQPHYIADRVTADSAIDARDRQALFHHLAGFLNDR